MMPPIPLIREWTGQALQTVIEPRPFSGNASKYILVLMLIICVVIASLISKILPTNAAEDRPFFANRLRPFIVFGYGIACGVGIMKFITPLSFLHMKEGEVLASLLLSRAS